MNVNELVNWESIKKVLASNMKVTQWQHFTLLVFASGWTPCVQ